jgi:hypothetical protein
LVELVLQAPKEAATRTKSSEPTFCFNLASVQVGTVPTVEAAKGGSARLVLQNFRVTEIGYDCFVGTIARGAQRREMERASGVT